MIRVRDCLVWPALGHRHILSIRLHLSDERSKRGVGNCSEFGVEGGGSMVQSQAVGLMPMLRPWN